MMAESGKRTGEGGEIAFPEDTQRRAVGEGDIGAEIWMTSGRKHGKTWRKGVPRRKNSKYRCLVLSTSTEHLRISYKARMAGPNERNGATSKTCDRGARQDHSSQGVWFYFKRAGFWVWRDDFLKFICLLCRKGIRKEENWCGGGGEKWSESE